MLSRRRSRLAPSGWHADLVQPPETMPARRALIRETMLQQSRGIQTPNFARCHDADLRLLLNLYDAHCFAGQLHFRLSRGHCGSVALRYSNRLRSAGGKTIRQRTADGAQYAIEIASRVLMCNFVRPGDSVVICGLPCGDRLDALMRVMEHELIHLAEFLFDGNSRCSAKPFRAAAAALFGHVAHQHAMITPRQRVLAATHIRPGNRVRFNHDQSPLLG
ncbi:MAG TPA: hypothetical protein VGB55_02510, partial [Tepidisphaeraceae bacterium]